MSYLLDKDVAAKLRAVPTGDKGVARVIVGIAPDHDGEERLFFRVVLKDDPSIATPSEELGKRLQRIATALRRRAAELGVPMFAHVDFIAESEIPPQRRKTA